MLILSTKVELDNNSRYAVVHSNNNFCMFYGALFSCDEKQYITGDDVQTYNEYTLKPVPNISDKNADKFDDMSNAHIKHKFFKQFPSHILCTDGQIKDLTVNETLL